MTPLLQVRLAIDYAGRTRVLDDAEFDVRPGEIVGLVGSSGSGKSSLALAILGLLDGKGGRAYGGVWFHGGDLLRASEREMRAVRGQRVSFVPQSPTSFLNPAMRLDAQLHEAWKAHKCGHRTQMEHEVREVVEHVGLSGEREFLHRYPGEVSVGQAQRILIAMAILHRPALLIADEPTSSLDVISQAEILNLLARLNRELGMAILYISHDLLSIASFCNRVAILSEGKIVEFSETDAIFDSPRHPYTQKLIGAIPAAPRLRVVPVRRTAMTTMEGVA
jgi:ABC-type dipeptide/oligopeptide/nickel transport system ATPase component